MAICKGSIRSVLEYSFPYASLALTNLASYQLKE